MALLLWDHIWIDDTIKNKPGKHHHSPLILLRILFQNSSIDYEHDYDNDYAEFAQFTAV